LCWQTSKQVSLRVDLPKFEGKSDPDNLLNS
jgi:hypothetical protein